MMVMRGALLLAAAAISLFAFGAADADLQPSALRVTTAVVFTLLAPLFWPGCAASRRGTALRIVVWSASACAMAGLSMQLWGGSRQSLPASLPSCAMLAAILLLAHAAAALLERLWARSGVEIGDAREAAGRTVALSLALLGSLPLWLGPAAELLSVRHAWAIDAALGVSPLTHLAVASGNDLLRNQWLYQHSNLSGLQFDYPGLGALAWSYGALCLVAGAIAMTAARRRNVGRPATPSHRPEDKTP
jgi:hypothetical protein